jgi:hypothetical protein
MWSHTTYLCPDDQVSLRHSEAQRISKPNTEIYVGQPGRKRPKCAMIATPFAKESFRNMNSDSRSMMLFKVRLGGLTQPTESIQASESETG